MVFQETPCPRQPPPKGVTKAAARASQENPTTPQGYAAALGVTRAAYAQIAIGMTYPEVARILSGPGWQMSETVNGWAGFSTAIYVWSSAGDARFPWRSPSITVMFWDGKVYQKSQAGLP